jgi:hypothetical protein
MNVWSIGSQRTPKCDEALNGLVSGCGDYPEKLHRVPHKHTYSGLLIHFSQLILIVTVLLLCAL